MLPFLAPACIALLLPSSTPSATQAVPRSSAFATRRLFVGNGLLFGAASAAGATVFDSTCFGFGCNSYQGVDYGGMAAPTDEDSVPFNDFLAMLKDPSAREKIVKVDIYGGAGDRIYVTTSDSKKFRLGEGTPIEDDNGWSSYLWVVRICDNNKVPHTYHFRPGDKP
mmetsp:Transcript_652/g.1764  ORF Transcript_652/g.1764 Transcript_652/m.1764 type:complete len:167 (-) Transcript_652:405-905(-)